MLYKIGRPLAPLPFGVSFLLIETCLDTDSVVIHTSNVDIRASEITSTWYCCCLYPLVVKTDYFLVDTDILVEPTLLFTHNAMSDNKIVVMSDIGIDVHAYVKVRSVTQFMLISLFVDIVLTDVGVYIVLNDAGAAVINNASVFDAAWY